MFRDFKNLNMDAFEKDLSAIDWSLGTENIDTDLSYKFFLQTKEKKKEKINLLGYKRYNKIYKSQRQIIQEIYQIKNTLRT